MQYIDNKDILIIINPNSGKKNIKKIVKEINSLNYNIAFVITNNLDELKNVFKSSIEKYKVFIVVGGDGTINETLQYLYNRNDKLLAVLPAGSGNGFSRELGFRDSIQSLINDTKKGELLNVDILSINENLCINTAGLGFDSFVAHIFQKSNRRGLKNYIYSTIKSIFKFKPFYAKLILDSKIIHGKFQMITIANTRQFGNNAIISPQSNPTDNIFELVLVSPFPFYLYPIFIIKLFSGTLKSSKFIKYIKVKDGITIESEFKKYHIDGEPKIFTHNLSIKMLKNKVKVIKTAHNNVYKSLGGKWLK
jgi:YegS/Rv2252/BmrU family lipid kinase